MGQPSNEEPHGEPLGFPVARLPGDPSPRAESEKPPEAQDEEPRASSAPSWGSYPQPMRAAEDTRDPNLHPRYWEAQLEAARRGSLAWGFLAFFLGYAGYYLVSVILSPFLPLREAGFDPSKPPALGPLLLLSFAPNIVLGLVPAVFSWTKGNGLRADFGIVPTWRDLRVGLTCGGIALLSSWVLGIVLISINGPPPDEGLIRLVRGQSGIWLFLFALFAFLGAPLTEELLMRGALWGALEHYRVPRYVILVLTSLIFAFVHEEAWRLPILFTGGLAMGAARMITGRVSTSMIAHATNNFLPALLLFVIAA